MKSHTELEQRFLRSRNNLLLVIAFTTVNVFLLLLNTDLSFLFSATFPIFFVGIGQVFTEQTGSNAFLLIGTVIAFISIALYAVCYFLSKKRKVFILVALVLFVLDTLLLLWLSLLEFEVSSLIDIAFHVWILYYLIIGVAAWSGLKKLPPEQEDVQTQESGEHP